MPISRDEFQRGRKVARLEPAILSFFRQHPAEAFTSQEVARNVTAHRFGVNFLQDVLVQNEVVNTLNVLVRENTLERKQVDLTIYYALRRG